MDPESKKIKIIFAGRYNPDEILSGPEKVAKRIYSRLQDKTDSVFVEYFFDGSKYSIWKKLFGKETIIDFQNNRIFKLGIIQILLYSIRFRPKIVHILSFERFVVIFFLLKFILRYKISYTINGIVAFENSNFQKNIKRSLAIKDRIAELLIIKFSNKLFFLSEDSIILAKKYYSFPESKIILTSNGIDKVFNQIYLERNKKEKNKLNIVVVADLSRSEKGLKFLLETIQPIKNDFIFNLIGDSYIDDEDTEIKYFPKLPTDEFAKFLLNQDIFISASFYDTFSITTLEAMAAGVIPLVTKETGVSKFIVDGENGFVYDYGDMESLRKQLLKIKNDFHLKIKLSRNAASIFNRFLWENISKEYLEKFNLMLNE